ncbi:hypothetical protein GLOTRDRAFT_126980 [Gloeophyllum trabeum ATCC 11539]|uniref:NADH dehydrogenase [ubiquinone] 1 beta subcomplex subunit 4 n=1 Tax=Gloeophyllum trabeum (strain ATCC 11539 / FP-39264 / Madison 617) TaxID=670483 RepID=S7QH59_GLOTA|nr:uncharacterized protein GLOTRDRAFT_126980 [Gloeophyllum trabeum ATCC 11539]EPQ58482.1 hypothetical protein GLOTRDRAFT_126980 [Gloeophyllum trabeum ATCC 11539]
MAGGHEMVKHDPAIEKWNSMRENAYKHFRFTPRNTFIALVGVVIVPGAVLYLASQTDNKWNFNGKRKGESLRIQPSQQASS